MEFAAGWRTQGAAIIVGLILLASPARAGCSLEDIGNAFYGTLKATATCKSVCENEAACAAAVALDIALGGAAVQGSDTGQGQQLVNQFCKEAQGTADQIVGKLNTIFGNAIAKEVLGDLSSQLSSVGSAAQVVRCACETEQSTNSLGDDLGQCVDEALCGWFGVGCDCKRPPPQTANCSSIDVKKCKEDHDYSGIWNPACIPSGTIHNTNPDWKQGGSYADYSSKLLKEESSQGTLVLQLPPAVDNCTPAQTCFCPKPMVPSWHEIPNPNSGDHMYTFSCDCPYEPKNPDHQTHPGGMLPSGISQCICNNTGQPANFGLAPFGMCPPPACPAGQIRLSLNGECVSPCSDPSQGMAFDGSCCNPAQMTSCGQCCPPGTMPDSKNGTCVPKQIVK